MEPVGFLQEISQGKIKNSIMRLMSLICAINSSVMAYIILFKYDKIEWYHLLLVLMFLIGAFAPKSFQKIAEQKFIK